MSEINVISRYEGCVVGAAVGDALGAPFEFTRPVWMAKMIQEDPYLLTEMRGGGGFMWEPGQTTDDTDMATAVLGSMVENKGYNPQDISNRFVMWLQSDPKDIGGLTRNSLSLIEKGTSYKDAGNIILNRSKRPPVANGSVMRTYPVGLLYRGNNKLMFNASDEVSAMTHAHKDCLLACRMTSATVAHLASGVSKDQLPEKLQRDFKDTPAIDQLLEEAQRGETHRAKYKGYGAAFESFNIAFSSLMKSEDFEDALKLAIGYGWDTDTQTTVAGAFAGALYGIDGIPQLWKDQLNAYDLEANHKMGTEALTKKAKILYQVNIARFLPKKRFWQRFDFVI